MDNNQNIEIKFTRTVEVKPEQMADLLVTALEGGSNYWYLIGERTRPEGLLWDEPGRPVEENGKFWHIAIPMTPGGDLQILDAEEYVEDEPETHIELGHLNRENLEKGLRLMAEQFPKDFQEFIDGDYDANTADCFMQLAVMGEVVYG